MILRLHATTRLTKKSSAVRWLSAQPYGIKASRSSQVAHMVQEKCKTALILPNATRWNSYYNAVEKLHSIVSKNKSESTYSTFWPTCYVIASLLILPITCVAHHYTYVNLMVLLLSGHTRLHSLVNTVKLWIQLLQRWTYCKLKKLLHDFSTANIDVTENQAGEFKGNHETYWATNKRVAGGHQQTVWTLFWQKGLNSS